MPCSPQPTSGQWEPILASGRSSQSDLWCPAPVGMPRLESQGSGSSTGGLAAQIAGFKILSYDGTDATIDIAFRLNTGNLVSVPQALQWSDGDWKVLLNDDGQSSFGRAHFRASAATYLGQASNDDFSSSGSPPAIGGTCPALSGMAYPTSFRRALTTRSRSS